MTKSKKYGFFLGGKSSDEPNSFFWYETETLLYEDFNNEDNIPYCDNNYRENMKTASSDECSKPTECKIEIPDVIKSENTKLDDLNEDDIEQTIVANTAQDDIVEPIIEESTVVKNDKKKKRAYKKKK